MPAHSFGHMVSKYRPTPDERDERIKVDLPATAFIEGVLAVEVADYDVHNFTTKKGTSIHGSLDDAHRAVNELVGSEDDWAVIRMPLGGKGSGQVVSEGRGPVASEAAE
jgi:hypothetical protein